MPARIWLTFRYPTATNIWCEDGGYACATSSNATTGSPQKRGSAILARCAVKATTSYAPSRSRYWCTSSAKLAVPKMTTLVAILGALRRRELIVRQGEVPRISGRQLLSRASPQRRVVQSNEVAVSPFVGAPLLLETVDAFLGEPGPAPVPARQPTSRGIGHRGGENYRGRLQRPR